MRLTHLNGLCTGQLEKIRVTDVGELLLHRFKKGNGPGQT